MDHHANGDGAGATRVRRSAWIWPRIASKAAVAVERTELGVSVVLVHSDVEVLVHWQPAAVLPMDLWGG